MSKEKVIMVTTLLSHRTCQGRINIDFGESPQVQLSIEEARALGLNILHAAEGAESDEFLFAFIRDDLKVGDQAGMAVLQSFRAFREAPIDKRTRPLPPLP